MTQGARPRSGAHRDALAQRLDERATQVFASLARRELEEALGALIERCPQGHDLIDRLADWVVDPEYAYPGIEGVFCFEQVLSNAPREPEDIMRPTDMFAQARANWSEPRHDETPTSLDDELDEAPDGDDEPRGEWEDLVHRESYLLIALLPYRFVVRLRAVMGEWSDEGWDASGTLQIFHARDEPALRALLGSLVRAAAPRIEDPMKSAEPLYRKLHGNTTWMEEAFHIPLRPPSAARP